MSRCAVSRHAVPLAAPPRPPRRSSRYRGAFTRPARWHGASARSRPAQRAITPQQWSQRAGTPQQWIQRAGTPHPRPLRVEIRAALHPAESVATLRHRYGHSVLLRVQFVATDCMANCRRSVSSRLGHLYVPHASAPMSAGHQCVKAPSSHGTPHVKRTQTRAQKSPHHEDAGPPKPAASR